MVPTITKKPEEIRAQVKEEAEWFRVTGREAQRRWMKLGNLLQVVRDRVLWKDWKANGKTFQTFDHYVEEEVGVSKSKVYMMLGVVDHLSKKLSHTRMEELGKTRCYELARLAAERPKQLDRVLQKVENNPNIPVNEVRDIVEAAIENRAYERFQRLEFAVKEGDVATVIEALAVMQAGEPVENPDSASGRGVHLVNVCREYLSGEEETRVLKELKKNGFFKKVPFELEG